MRNRKKLLNLKQSSLELSRNTDQKASKRRQPNRRSDSRGGANSSYTNLRARSLKLVKLRKIPRKMLLSRSSVSGARASPNSRWCTREKMRSQLKLPRSRSLMQRKEARSKAGASLRAERRSRMMEKTWKRESSHLPTTSTQLGTGGILRRRRPL